MRVFCTRLHVVLFILMAGCVGDDSSNEYSVPLNAFIDASANEVEVGQAIEFSPNGSTGYVREVYGPIRDADWELLKRPEDSVAQLGFNRGLPQLVPDVVGIYTVRLTIHDADGNSDSDVISVSATNATPSVTVTAQPESYEKRVGETIELSGAKSSDANGGDLSYSWRITGAPFGSVARLSADDMETVTFVADVKGQYTVELVVSDGEKQAKAEYRFHAWENHPPIIVIDTLPAFLDDEPMTIDASHTDDENNNALTYAWEMVSQPAGSAPTLEQMGAQATLTPDGQGIYDIRLAVNDGYVTAERTFSIASVEEFARLPDEIADAEYDAVNDRIVMVSASSNDLIVMDARTRAISRMDLAFTPLAVSVSPDGSEAAIGHYTQISVVDLDALIVLNEFPVSASPSDIVHAGNGYAYVFPDSGQWTNIRSIELAIGNETLSTGPSIRHRTLARKQPGSNTIYGADTGSSPGDIEKYDISAGTAANLYGSPYHGVYGMCGNLWFTEDGARIITACGNTFNTSDVRDFDMMYTGALELNDEYGAGGYQLISVDHSADSGMIASIQHMLDDTPDFRILRHDATSHALIDERGLPSFQDTAGKRPLNALFVFHQADTDRLLVVADIQDAGTAQTIILRY